jgi:hypothetical protein
MKTLRYFVFALSILFGGQTTFGSITSFGWSIYPPASVAAGQNYTIAASGSFYWEWYDDDYGHYGWSDRGAWGDVWIYRNGMDVASASGLYYADAGQTFNESSSGFYVTYSAAAADDAGNSWPLPEERVYIGGVRPNASISIDGYSSGQTIVRPAGGGVNVTVRYKATDPDSNLSGIRPQVRYPSGSLNNNNGNFVPQSGSSGEVVWTVTLDQNGPWRFWTDAQDAEMAPSGTYVDSGSGDSGFLLNVVENQESPNLNFTVSQSTIYVGETITLTSAASDPNNDMAFHSFWWDQGVGAPWTSPQFEWEGVEPSNAGWSSISNYNGAVSNSAGQTITANWTAFMPGTYYFHSNAYDSRGGWGNGPVHAVTVVNRSPTLTYEILDGGQNPRAPHTNGKVVFAPGENFYVRMTAHDPDGRLSGTYLDVNNPGGVNIAAQGKSATGFTATHVYGPYNASAAGTYDVIAYATDADAAEWYGPPDFNGNNYGWATQGALDILVGSLPSGVTVSGPPGTLVIGQAFSLASDARDSDGDLTRHYFWVRGARDADNFSGDWSGWSHDNIANWSNAGAATNGAHSVISATFTPSVPGYWQFHANAHDQFGNWGGGATTGAVFVAPVPTATLHASGNGASASGGGNLTIYTGQAVTLSSEANSGGWLSLHHIFGYTDNNPANWFSPPSGALALSASASSTHSSRTISWTPTTAGTYILYSEAFTGRTSGERIGGASGYPGYYDGHANKRIAITVRNPEAASITNSGATYGAESFDVYINNVAGAVGIACPTWTSYNGQDDLQPGWESHGYEAVYEPANNRWRFTVRRTEHNREYGNYIVHLYARDAAGQLHWLGQTQLDIPAPQIDSISTSGGSAVTGNTYKIYVSGVTGATRMVFPTWTEADSQDDLIYPWWNGDYDGTYNTASSRWEFTVNRADHAHEFGRYITHVYSVDSIGHRIFHGEASVVMTNGSPTVEISVLDDQRRPLPVRDGKSIVQHNSTYYLKVLATDPEGNLGGVFIRAAAGGVEFISQDRPVGGASGSYEFGPFVATQEPQLIDLWAHSVDAENNWADAGGPDMQINRAPQTTVTQISGGTTPTSTYAVNQPLAFNFSATDSDENLRFLEIARQSPSAVVAGLGWMDKGSDASTHTHAQSLTFTQIGLWRVWVNARDSAGSTRDPWAHNLTGEIITVRIVAAELADGDGDGMPNTWETLNGFDPNDNSDALADADSDSINNLTEYNLGTNPRVATPTSPTGTTNLKIYRPTP